MAELYSDYVWKNGLPYGIQKCTDESYKKGISYKIASDPYHKRVSIEQYKDGEFCKVLYDSALFDFRQLQLGEQLAWQKTEVRETDDAAVCHIRNQDDRLILIEEYRFEKELCRECKAFTPFGALLSIQKISYTAFKDSFNGVTLFDSNDHAVMMKHYEFDEELKEFTQLLKEDWALLKETTY